MVDVLAFYVPNKGYTVGGLLNVKFFVDNKTYVLQNEYNYGGSSDVFNMDGKAYTIHKFIKLDDGDVMSWELELEDDYFGNGRTMTDNASRDFWKSLRDKKFRILQQS